MKPNARSQLTWWKVPAYALGLTRLLLALLRRRPWNTENRK